jgi:segregation and condensation protein A
VALPPDEQVPGSPATFDVHLDNFEGPFDLLLTLIGNRRLDITEVALGQVTDDFIAYLKAMEAAEGAWNLGKASEFLVVAATLLDLKAVRLLPGSEVEDPEDLALLEARDLLFARLLQYRAYKEVAMVFGDRLAALSGSLPRQVPLEPQYAALLPELVFHLTPYELAAYAAHALASHAEPPEVDLTHLHAPLASVRVEAELVTRRLRSSGTVAFRQLVAGTSRQVLIVRFLALLELYRLGAVGFEQAEPLSELVVRWTGADDVEYVLAEGETEYMAATEEEPA